LFREKRRLLMSYTDVNRARVGQELSSKESLVARLSSKDGVTRMRARRALVSLGPSATEELTAVIGDPRVQVRWEATKALAEIADPEAAGALVRLLRDEDFGVRWLAAEGLVRLRRDGLIPLLEILSRQLVSERFRAGAHHVIHGQMEGSDGEILRPILEALSGFAARESAPLAARRALAALER
jgi:HEAT repeat protein